MSDFGFARVPVVVLGARVPQRRFASADEPLGGAIGRRTREAARVFFAIDAPFVIASGGCAWDGVVEADAMTAALEREGVPRARIVRDRCSLSTSDNARYAAAALAKRGYGEAVLVTCTWHMARASDLFRKAGVATHEHPVDGPPATLGVRVWRWGHEIIAARLAGVR